MTRRVLLTMWALLTVGVAPLAAQEHGAAKAPEKAAAQAAPATAAPATPAAAPAPPKHGIIRKGGQRPAGAPRPVDPVKVAPAASTEAVAAAIAAAVRSVEEKKSAATPRHSERPRVAAPKRRYVVQWPSQRLQVHWSSPDERVTLSWNDTASETP